MEKQKFLVKDSCNQPIGMMSKGQAMRYGQKNMPADLKKAGFKTVVFQSDVEIHGAVYLRVNYGK